MKWQFDDDRPIYQQIVEQIEMAVVSGEYAPGEKIAGVRELAAQAGVNPNTMQRALAELESRGILYSQRTSGRFVTEDGDKINQMRYLFARGLTSEYLKNMASLKYSSSEIVEFIKEAK